MVRSILTAAGVLAIIATGALADPMDGSSTTTKIIRTNPDGKTVIRKDVDRYGNMVTHRKTVHEGFGGSTVTRSRTTTDPSAGGSTTTVERKTIDR